MKKRILILFVMCFSLSACATEEPLALELPPQIPTAIKPSLTPKLSASGDDQSERLDQILADLGKIRTRFKQGEGVSSAPSERDNLSKKTLTKNPASSKSNVKKTTTAKETQKKPSALDADNELAQVLNTLSSAPYIDAVLEKVEKNINTGKATSVTLKTITKAPNVVRFEIIKSSINNGGTKASYTSGVGNKIQVRPGGALGFIKTEFDKDNKLLRSENGFLLDEMDFFGVSKRLSSGYNAKLIGKSQQAGETIHILKVTPESGENTLSSIIQYEYIGYEPKTHAIRLWEMYGAESTPFFKLSISQLSFPSQISDAKFKV